MDKIYEATLNYISANPKKSFVLHMIAIVLGFIFMFTVGMAGLVNMISSKAGLDNRPRWMMGGLRDDTGSHNAKDVFGMGFGLDQTKKGVATVDDKYKVKLGQSQLTLDNKIQKEYGYQMGN